MKLFFGIAGGVALFFVTIFALNYFGYSMFAFFAPKYEAVRREQMLQSRAYSEGETRNLYRLKIQYESAPSPEAKTTIRLAAKHECEALDRSRLPIELSTFCNPMGGN